MALKNTSDSWGWPARLLHWVVASLILFQLGLGLYATRVLTGQDMETLVARFYAVQTHKSWGVVIFALVLVRLVWRLVNPRPALPDRMSATERALAEGTHLALYALIVAMPLSGWLFASASTLQESYGIRNTVFGLFELPDPFVPGSKELEDLLRQVHGYMAFGLMALVALHVVAAFKHEFHDRDGMLRRMIRGR